MDVGGSPRADSPIHPQVWPPPARQAPRRRWGAIPGGSQPQGRGQAVNFFLTAAPAAEDIDFEEKQWHE